MNLLIDEIIYKVLLSNGHFDKTINEVRELIEDHFDECLAILMSDYEGRQLSECTEYLLKFQDIFFNENTRNDK
jgi:hypothetical protein